MTSTSSAVKLSCINLVLLAFATPIAIAQWQQQTIDSRAIFAGFASSVAVLCGSAVRRGR
jgi:hypothetical protein